MADDIYNLRIATITSVSGNDIQVDDPDQLRQTTGGSLINADFLVWPSGATPTKANAEFVRPTADASGTFTLSRQQQSSNLRSIQIGDRIALAWTKTHWDQLWTAINAKAASSSLATVATTGAYSDLSGKPTIPSSIDNLTDVDTSTVAPTDGQSLVWNNASSLWKPATISGGGMTNPMTTLGDIIYGGASGTPTRLAKGTDGQVLTLASGVPTWAAASGGGSSYLAIQTTTGTAASATGTDAIAIGKAASASATDGIAIGDGASVGDASSIAIGPNAKGATSGTGTNILIGKNVQIGSTGSLNIIIGKYATAITNSLISQIKIGHDQPSNNGGTNSVAIGNGAYSYDSKGVAIGYQSNTNGGTESLAVGQAANCGAAYSVAIGNGAQAAFGASYAISIGYNSVINNFGGNSSQIAIGYTAQTGFEYAIAIGANTYANYHDSVALGNYARTYSAGEIGISAGRFAISGDAQFSTYLMRVQTTNATQTALLPGGTASQHININNYQLIHVEGVVVGRRSGTYEYAAYQVSFDVKRDNTASTTALIGTPTITAIHESDVAWDVSVTVNTTSGYVDVNVTGAASKTINWFAKLESTQVMTTS